MRDRECGMRPSHNASRIPYPASRLQTADGSMLKADGSIKGQASEFHCEPYGADQVVQERQDGGEPDQLPVAEARGEGQSKDEAHPVAPALQHAQLEDARVPRVLGVRVGEQAGLDESSERADCGVCART